MKTSKFLKGLAILITLASQANSQDFSYSQSDIIIFIPNEKTLVVGDIFNKNRLPIIKPGTDLDKWEKLFAPYISENSDIKYFLGGHGGVLTVGKIKEQFNYIRELYTETKRIKGEGKTVEEAMKELAFEDFPYLCNFNPYFFGTAIHTHNNNINSIWRQFQLPQQLPLIS